MPVRGPHHGDLASDTVKPDEAVHRWALDGCLSLELHAQLDEERLGGLDVVNHDEHVVDPQSRHIPRLGNTLTIRLANGSA